MRDLLLRLMRAVHARQLTADEPRRPCPIMRFSILFFNGHLEWFEAP